MSLTRLFAATVILAFVSIPTVHARGSRDVRPIRRPVELDQALADATTVLNAGTTCAALYGDPAISVSILQQAVSRMAPETMSNSSVGIRMSGQFVEYVDRERGMEYRLFPQAKINLNGPFFRTMSVVTTDNLPNVGSFRPNTREARVLMLLHELAHLIAPKGDWLIPDDGGHSGLSANNTRFINSRCGDSIRRAIA